MQQHELPQIGHPLEGGFYTGLIIINSLMHAVITSPKSLEITAAIYGNAGIFIQGASSTFDSHGNTLAMAEAGSEIARKVMAIDHEGFKDWAIAARDLSELQYRKLKPTADENWCSFRDGDNASSVPPGFPYTKQDPLQTNVEHFKAEGGEAFDPVFYLTSTQYSAYYAYVQGFEDGRQYYRHKTDEFRVRPVRILLIS